MPNWSIRENIVGVATVVVGVGGAAVERQNQGRVSRGARRRLRGARGMLRGPPARRSISRVAGRRRARPSASRTTPFVPQSTPTLPTTRLFNTYRIWDTSIFVLNDRAT